MLFSRWGLRKLCASSRRGLEHFVSFYLKFKDLWFRVVYFSLSPSGALVVGKVVCTLSGEVFMSLLHCVSVVFDYIISLSGHVVLSPSTKADDPVEIYGKKL